MTRIKEDRNSDINQFSENKRMIKYCMKALNVIAAVVEAAAAGTQLSDMNRWRFRSHSLRCLRFLVHCGGRCRRRHSLCSLLSKSSVHLFRWGLLCTLVQSTPRNRSVSRWSWPLPSLLILDLAVWIRSTALHILLFLFCAPFHISLPQTDNRK